MTSSYARTNIGLPLANIAHQSFSLLSKYKAGELLGPVPDVLEIGGQSIYRSKIWRQTISSPMAPPSSTPTAGRRRPSPIPS
ncbi:MAG: hypothetical protein U1E25_16080 [Methylocystis sp.]